jgi:prefoldin beta subunit
MATHMPEQLVQLRKQHDAQVAEMKKVQEQLGKLAENMQEYIRQKLENEMVLSELKLLSDDSAVFKKIGPCLIKQDMLEATSNVDKRIEYIDQELSRIEDQKTAAEEKRAKVGKAIRRIEGDVQAFMKHMEAAQQRAESS